MCMYLSTQVSIVQLRGMDSLLDSDSAVNKPELHMTRFFLYIKSHFLMFLQAALFINMPVLVIIICLTFDSL